MRRRRGEEGGHGCKAGVEGWWGVVTGDGNGERNGV